MGTARLASARLGRVQPRAVAQLVEHRSPKPAVGGSSPSCPAHALGSRDVLVVPGSDSSSRCPHGNEPRTEARAAESRPGRTATARPSPPASAVSRSPSRPRKRAPARASSSARSSPSSARSRGPPAQETIRLAVIVLIAIVVLTLFIFGLRPAASASSSTRLLNTTDKQTSAAAVGLFTMRVEL